MINRRLIRIKVLQALYAYSKKNDGISSLSAEKELFHSIDKFYDLYLLLLLMSVEMANLENERIEMRRNKKVPSTEDMNPSTRFAKNSVITTINSSQELSDLLKQRKLNWKVYSEVLKRIFSDFIADAKFIDYLNTEGDSIIEDRKIIEYFYSDFISDNQHFNEFLEEENIYWNDDLSFALMMVNKTIEMIKPGKKVNIVLPLFKNDEDKDFAKNLLRTTIVKREEFLKIIEKHTQNWDTERIAQMDLLILQMAIAELYEFKSIPVKVTLNEFIEISKYYSTDKSKIFINGVLDNIIKSLDQDGSIKKTGRGLIDK